MPRSSKLWSGALGTTNTFVFALRLGSWALTSSKLTPRLLTDRPLSRLCSLGEGEEILVGSSRLLRCCPASHKNGQSEDAPVPRTLRTGSGTNFHSLLIPRLHSRPSLLAGAQPESANAELQKLLDNRALWRRTI